MKIRNIIVKTALGFCLVFLGAGQAVALESDPSQETIVFVRHGEKPEQGLGQLNCQGLNRALALPKVLDAQFGKPVAIFASDPSKPKEDDGKLYDYVRPLATIEPTAIRLGLPVDTSYGFEEIDKLQAALEQPVYHGATLFVAWEHRLIEALVKQLMAAHGGKAEEVPKWKGSDFDSIYVVTISWPSAGAPASGTSIVFKLGHEGLNGQSAACLP